MRSPESSAGPWPRQCWRLLRSSMPCAGPCARSSIGRRTPFRRTIHPHGLAGGTASRPGQPITLGLSLAFGAFLAGMMLGETEFRHQVESSIRPFRDVLLGLFFVGIGMLIDPVLSPHLVLGADGCLAAAVEQDRGRRPDRAPQRRLTRSTPGGPPCCWRWVARIRLRAAGHCARIQRDRSGSRPDRPDRRPVLDDRGRPADPLQPRAIAARLTGPAAGGSSTGGSARRRCRNPKC
ncbi:MAG: cation:proton antiporter [Sulfuritalea sp.]|nr:cation:proton antiporter [Sulfuritalea sp.]